MKVRKWITLVFVLMLLFSVGCATGGATSGGTLTNIGVATGGGGYRNVTP